MKLVLWDNKTPMQRVQKTSHGVTVLRDPESKTEITVSSKDVVKFHDSPLPSRPYVDPGLRMRWEAQDGRRYF